MSKSEADYLLTIDVPWLRKHGYFDGYRSGGISWTRGGFIGDENKSSIGITASILDDDNYVRLIYAQTDRHTGEKRNFDYKIPLTTTPCNFGGKRYWFICPWYKNGVYCGKRVGTLYKDGDYFACRHCYDLTYGSRKVNRRYKLFNLFRVLDLKTRIEKLHKQIKRPFYKGKPTRKYQQLEKLQAQAGIMYRNHLKYEDDKML